MKAKIAAQFYACGPKYAAIADTTTLRVAFARVNPPGVNSLSSLCPANEIVK
jgi:hypothetical protein